MFMDILQRLNWVDLVVAALLVRIIYMAIYEGVVAEVFKCFAVVVALFFAFHFYLVIAHIVTRRVNGPEDMVFTQSFGFVAVWLAVLFIFKYIRQGAMLLLSIEAKSLLDRWGGVTLGILRFVVSASMLLFVLLASGMRYLEVKAAESVSGKYMATIAPAIYEKICNGFVTRLVPSQKYNLGVRETLKKVSKD